MVLIRGFLILVLVSTLSACSSNFFSITKSSDSNQKQAKQEIITKKETTFDKRTTPAVNDTSAKTDTVANDTKKDEEKPKSFFARIANSDFFSITPKDPNKEKKADKDKPKSYFDRLFSSDFFKITRSTDIKKQAEADKNKTAVINIEKDKEKPEAKPEPEPEPIDWSTATSYRQWKNARDGIVEPTGANNQEYQEYLQWLEFQKLKNQK